MTVMMKKEAEEMGNLFLTLACGDYDRIKPLTEGQVKIRGIDLNHIPIEPKELFWRMLRHKEFDASELSLAAYTITRAQGKKWFMAVPVFPSRVFRHSAIYIHEDSGIKKPQDLAGKKVGIREYHMTAAVWVRGILQHEYGVPPNKINWFRPEGEERIDYPVPKGLPLKSIPENKSIYGMLEAGELDALVDPAPPISMCKPNGSVRRLFPDYKAVEMEYFRKTKIFPIMHTLVVKHEIHQRYPWVTSSLYNAFCQAKEVCYRKLYPRANHLTGAWLDVALAEERQVLGDDPWPYGLEANRHTIETLIQYLHEQGLIASKMPVEELFAPNTLGEPLG
jgi:4,5-dihydroxyphthalate decarboxylase